MFEPVTDSLNVNASTSNQQQSHMRQMTETSSMSNFATIVPTSKVLSKEALVEALIGAVQSGHAQFASLLIGAETILRGEAIKMVMDDIKKQKVPANSDATLINQALQSVKVETATILERDEEMRSEWRGGLEDDPYYEGCPESITRLIHQQTKSIQDIVDILATQKIDVDTPDPVTGLLLLSRVMGVKAGTALTEQQLAVVALLLMCGATPNIAPDLFSLAPNQIAEKNKSSQPALYKLFKEYENFHLYHALILKKAPKVNQPINVDTDLIRGIRDSQYKFFKKAINDFIEHVNTNTGDWALFSLYSPENADMLKGAAAPLKNVIENDFFTTPVDELGEAIRIFISQLSINAFKKNKYITDLCSSLDSLFRQYSEMIKKKQSQALVTTVPRKESAVVAQVEFDDSKFNRALAEQTQLVSDNLSRQFNEQFSGFLQQAQQSLRVLKEENEHAAKRAAEAEQKAVKLEKKVESLDKKHKKMDNQQQKILQLLNEIVKDNGKQHLASDDDEEQASGDEKNHPSSSATSKTYTNQRPAPAPKTSAAAPASSNVSADSLEGGGAMSPSNMSFIQKKGL